MPARKSTTAPATTKPNAALVLAQNPRGSRCWLMKSEPDVYSIDDLKRDGSTCWEGVRNYQARNFMRDEMEVGDWVLFYHSNAKPPGIAGLAKVSREAYPDDAAFDRKSKYFDAKSDPKNPRWVMVDIAHVETFAELIPLDVLRKTPKVENLLLLQRGQRLSIQPVDGRDFKAILKMAKATTKVTTRKVRKARSS